MGGVVVGPQVKGGKIDPWFHAMFASSLLSFGAMYPYALGKSVPLSAKAGQLPWTRNGSGSLLQPVCLAEGHIEKNPARFFRCA